MAKAVQKQALGRGLSALLKDPNNDIKSVDDKNADKVVGNIIELDIDAIEINPFQPRTPKYSLGILPFPTLMEKLIKILGEKLICKPHLLTNVMIWEQKWWHL